MDFKRGWRGGLRHRSLLAFGYRRKVNKGRADADSGWFMQQPVTIAGNGIQVLAFRGNNSCDRRM